MPKAKVRVWASGDCQPADYALVWNPPAAMLKSCKGWKAVFVLGAGVDALLDKLQKQPDLLPADIPIFRLEDTGMGLQMQEYAVSQVLRWFRRFDDYQILQQQRIWTSLPEYRREDFTIGILGAGILGRQVAESLVKWGFPVRCWSRSKKSYPDIRSFASESELTDFLSGVKVLINLLPSTPQTVGIINRHLLERLVDESYVMNLARGLHLVEEDLLASLKSGKVKAAMLDVFAHEPLAEQSPLWNHPGVMITPHIAAMTKLDQAIAQIIKTITLIEKGKPVSNAVSRHLGY